MIASRIASSISRSRSSSIRSSIPQLPPLRGIAPLTAQRSSQTATRISTLVAVALTLLALTAGATAAAKPGTPSYVRATAVAQVLQRTVDFARCAGIQRFGTVAGSYVVFDCRTQLDGRVCRGVRVKAVHGVRPGTFRLVTLRRGVCA